MPGLMMPWMKCKDIEMSLEETITSDISDGIYESVGRYTSTTVWRRFKDEDQRRMFGKFADTNWQPGIISVYLALENFLKPEINK